MDYLGTVGLTINAGDPLTYGFVLAMPLLVSFNVARSSCLDPTKNGPMLWEPALGIPCIVDSGPSTAVREDGTLSGTRSGRCVGSGLLDQTWAWNLAPAPPP